MVFASPFITRLYTPADMGTVASLLAITAILGVIATGTYDQAIVLPENETDINAIVFLSGSISVLFGLTITFILFLFHAPFISIFNLHEISSIWVYSIGFIVILISFDFILSKLATKRRQFKVLATTAVSQQIGTSGIKIGAGLLGFGINGLLFATLFASLVRGSCLFFTQKVFICNKKNIPTFERVKQVALRYIKFPLFSSWSTLLNVASVQLPIIMFANFFSAGVAGHFVLSYGMLSLPMGVIGQNVGRVFSERASNIVHTDFDDLKRISFAIYKKLLVIGSVVLSFVVFYGDIIFSFIFGTEWVIAGQYAKWISVWLIFQFTASPLAPIYFVLEKQKELLVFNATMFMLRLAIIGFAFIKNFNDVKTIALFSVISATLYLFLSIRMLYMVKTPMCQVFQSFLVIITPIFILQYTLSFFVRNLFGAY